MINSAKNLTIRANLEPIAGLKIDLNANRVDTRSTDIYYMQDGMPEQMGGSFTMTTIPWVALSAVAETLITVIPRKRSINLSLTVA